MCCRLLTSEYLLKYVKEHVAIKRFPVCDKSNVRIRPLHLSLNLSFKGNVLLLANTHQDKPSVYQDKPSIYLDKPSIYLTTKFNPIIYLSTSPLSTLTCLKFCLWLSSCMVGTRSFFTSPILTNCLPRPMSCLVWNQFIQCGSVSHLLHICCHLTGWWT